MIDPQLLKMLVCPESRTRLEMADSQLIRRINKAISEKKLLNKAGQKVSDPLQGGLIREDHAILYPIIDGIPTLLVEEGISVHDLEG